MPPFPHEYSRDAEYLIRMMEYNMRVRMWDFIRAAAKVDPDGKMPTRQVLLMAFQKQHEEVAVVAKERFASEVNTDRLLDELGLRAEL